MLHVRTHMRCGGSDLRVLCFSRRGYDRGRSSAAAVWGRSRVQQRLHHICCLPSQLLCSNTMDTNLKLRCKNTADTDPRNLNLRALLYELVLKLMTCQRSRRKANGGLRGEDLLLRCKHAMCGARGAPTCGLDGVLEDVAEVRGGDVGGDEPQAAVHA